MHSVQVPGQVDALREDYVQDRIQNSPLKALGLGFLTSKDLGNSPAGPATSNSRLIESDLVYIKDSIALILSEICTPPLSPTYTEVLDAIRVTLDSFNNLTPVDLKVLVEAMSDRASWDFVPEGLQKELAELEDEQAARPLEGGGY